MNIYVGNLSYDTSEADLEAAFAVHGAVASVSLPTHRESGRPRGFGFVEMENRTEAEAAIRALNGTDLQGRTLTVNEAKPRESRDETAGYRSGRSRW